MASRAIPKRVKKIWTMPVVRKLVGKDAEEAVRRIVAANRSSVHGIK